MFRVVKPPQSATLYVAIDDVSPLVRRLVITALKDSVDPAHLPPKCRSYIADEIKLAFETELAAKGLQTGWNVGNLPLAK